jgi:hypothetical protein
MLTCLVFPAKLYTKKPATIEEAGEVLYTENVEPGEVVPPLSTSMNARLSEFDPQCAPICCQLKRF